MNIERANRYTLTAVLLHWLIAALVFSLFALGWYMVDLPRGPDRSYSFGLHKSIGLTVFALALARIAWRYFHRPPVYPRGMAVWRITIARAAHFLFYILLILQPLSGYLSSSFSGYKTKIFGLPLPHWGWRDPPLNEFFTEVHVMTSVFFVCLVVLHVLGALSHLFDPEDGIFRRILPW